MMLLRNPFFRFLNLLLCGAVVFSGAGCGILWRLLDDLTGEPVFDFRSSPAGAVTLRVINASGVPLVVEASYRIDDHDVRITKRFIPPEGPDSEADVLATVTAVLRVTAHVSLPDPTSQPTSQPTTQPESQPAGSQPTTSQSTTHPTSQPDFKPGDLVYDRELRWRIDFEEGSLLIITIPETTSAPATQATSEPS